MLRIALEGSEKIDGFENISQKMRSSAYMMYDFSQYDLRYMMCGSWEPILVNF